MKYIFLKARNIQPDGDLETAMADDSTTEVSNRNFKAPPNPFPPQTSAVNLLASMIGGADFPSLGATPTSGIGLPLLSPSPTLPNLLSTPSPTFPTFPFVFQDRQENPTPPVIENVIPPIAKQEDTAPQQQARLPIRIKLKKVASSDKYVIETPKGTIKQEPAPLAETIVDEYSALLEAVEFKPESGVTSQYQQGGSVEQFIPAAVNAGDQPMDFSTEIFNDNLVPDLLGNSSSVNVAGTSGVPSVGGIFQTLPGGASGSPAALEMDDPYGFDTGLGK